MVSPGEDLRLVSVPPNGPGKGLLHADNQGKQLRGDLPEELPFSFYRGQRMDQLPLLVFVGEDLLARLQRQPCSRPSAEIAPRSFEAGVDCQMVFLWQSCCLDSET